MEIKLEDTVKCKYTGVTGVVMAKTVFVNGCVQFSVAPKWNPNNPGIDGGEVCVDEQSLVIVKKGLRHKKDDDKEGTGGPMCKASRMRGF